MTFAAVSAVAVTLCCNDGGDSGLFKCPEEAATTGSFTMHGAESSHPDYSYVIKNYSKRHDVIITIDDETVTLGKAVNSKFDDVSFKLRKTNYIVKYSPANKVELAGDGTAFARFFDK
jgi:hypothetical protein